MCTKVCNLYRWSMMVLEGSCQMVPIVDPVDSGQWRYTAEPYIAETECCCDGTPWRWVEGMERGGGGWREKEGVSALSSSWTDLLAMPTALVAKHSYLWEDWQQPGELRAMVQFSKLPENFELNYTFLLRGAVILCYTTLTYNVMKGKSNKNKLHLVSPNYKCIFVRLMGILFSQ